MASSYGTDAGVSAIRMGYLFANSHAGFSSNEAADKEIARRLLAREELMSASLVLTYVSKAHEVDTKALIKELLSRGKRVAVPRSDENSYGSYLSFCEIHSLDELAPNDHGVLAPNASAQALSVKEMVGSVCLVPGLVFDADGLRVSEDPLFDRFLAFYPGEKIGLARTNQLSNNPLPRAKDVVALDALASDCVYWRCR